MNLEKIYLHPSMTKERNGDKKSLVDWICLKTVRWHGRPPKSPTLTRSQTNNTSQRFTKLQDNCWSVENLSTRNTTTWKRWKKWHILEESDEILPFSHEELHAGLKYLKSGKAPTQRWSGILVTRSYFGYYSGLTNALMAHTYRRSGDHQTETQTYQKVTYLYHSSAYSLSGMNYWTWPQGSTLAPILFNIYTNDQPTFSLADALILLGYYRSPTPGRPGLCNKKPQNHVGT